MTHKQLTVLTGNSAIQLNQVISHLSSEGIDIRAHCAVENGDRNCKLRMIVSEPDRAIDILRENGIAAVANEVVIVETDDKPGELSRMLQILTGAHIRVEFTYTAATERPGKAMMVFRFSDNQQAADRLKQKGLKLFAGKD